MIAGGMDRTAPAPPPRGLRLAPRDLDVLRFAVRHGMVLADQLSNRFLTGPVPAQRRLRALEVAGLLVRDRVLAALPAVVRATPRGARLAGCDLAPASLDLARVHHNLALVDLSEELLVTHPGSAWSPTPAAPGPPSASCAGTGCAPPGPVAPGSGSVGSPTGCSGWTAASGSPWSWT